MKLFSKLKNILFDEEEVEIPVIEKEVKREEVPVKPAPEIKQEPMPTKEVYNSDVKRTNIEALLDEKPRMREEYIEPKPRNTNILDYEKKFRKEKTNVFRTHEPEVKKAFRPSPVISPIYGVLDKEEYEKTTITRETIVKVRTTKVDVDEVRNKAFGTLEDEIVNTLDRPIEDFYNNDAPKTIDELLVDDIEEVDLNSNDEIDNEELSKLDILDEIEKEITPKKEEPKHNIDDTIESDLFKLIDSMYENREDGE